LALCPIAHVPTDGPGALPHRFGEDPCALRCSRTSGARTQRDPHCRDQWQGVGEPRCGYSASGAGPHGGPVHFAPPEGSTGAHPDQRGMDSPRGLRGFRGGPHGRVGGAPAQFFRAHVHHGPVGLPVRRGGPRRPRNRNGRPPRLHQHFPRSARDGDHLDRPGSPAISRPRPALHRRREGGHPQGRGPVRARHPAA